MGNIGSNKPGFIVSSCGRKGEGFLLEKLLIMTIHPFHFGNPQIVYKRFGLIIGISRMEFGPKWRVSNPSQDFEI